METIRLHNSKTRSKELFQPLDPSNVRMYVCGPTVYDRAHLGNARPVVVFDTLYRLLRHVYGADHVTYVRNFTDVDDKINATALARQKAGVPGTLEELIAARTEETIAWYHADTDALGALRPSAEPRATAYIGPMIAMIETPAAALGVRAEWLGVGVERQHRPGISTADHAAGLAEVVQPERHRTGPQVERLDRQSPQAQAQLLLERLTRSG